MRECVKKLREEWKIKLAWVMICTILLQALAGWRVIPVMAGETEKMDLSGYATPSDAFQHFICGRTGTRCPEMGLSYN